MPFQSDSFTPSQTQRFNEWKLNFSTCLVVGIQVTVFSHFRAWSITWPCGSKEKMVSLLRLTQLSVLSPAITMESMILKNRPNYRNNFWPRPSWFTRDFQFCLSWAYAIPSYIFKKRPCFNTFSIPIGKFKIRLEIFLLVFEIFGMQSNDVC